MAITTPLPELHTSPAAVRPPRLSPEHTKARRGTGLLGALVLLLGLALCAWGVLVMRSTMRFDWLPVQVRGILSPYVPNSESVLVGAGLLGAGALLFGLASRRLLGVEGSGLTIPLPRLRAGRAGLAALGCGLALFALLYWHLAARQYTHLDIAIFVVALAATLFGVHTLDAREGKPGAARTFAPADWGLAVLTAAVAGLANSLDLASWRYAWIGDEGSFFGMASDIAGGRIAWNIFSLRGVYDAHPVLDSAWQSWSIWLFGADVFGWRMSEVTLLALAGGLAYLAGAALIGRVGGLAAGLALGCSHYLMAFARIGYNNAHAAFVLALVILMMALAWRSGRAAHLFGLGAALALCLYTFLAATLSWPVVALLLLVSFALGLSRRTLIGIGLIGAGFALVIAPILITTGVEYIAKIATDNSLRQTPPGGWGSIVQPALVKSYVIFWSNFEWRHHYVGGPLFDPVGGTLLAAGVGAALLRLKGFAERLALVWFVLGVALVALTSYLPNPALTRLIVVMPAAALLAGLGAEALYRAFATYVRFGERVAGGLVAILLLASIPALNMKQLLVDSHAAIGANRETLIVKTLQTHPNNSVVEISPQPDGNIDVLLRMYPQIRLRYAYAHPEEVAPAALVNGLPPIYFISSENKGLLEVARTRLPGYAPVKSADAANRYSVTLLVPIRR